ncbi:hypothetical protein J1605_006404 [Eschrichtius robustus]|uniref:Secreted protein n=1 Tax=Eschrichtius robustus TaxID=9764 RepID=A0AB34H654_ESCRO|nr:hypothetical protein J1605_006404 [Eschrichtius robustus]
MQLASLPSFSVSLVVLRVSGTPRAPGLEGAAGPALSTGEGDVRAGPGAWLWGSLAVPGVALPCVQVQLLQDDPSGDVVFPLAPGPQPPVSQPLLAVDLPVYVLQAAGRVVVAWPRGWSPSALMPRTAARDRDSEWGALPEREVLPAAGGAAGPEDTWSSGSTVGLWALQ